jgi:hypothetical protein
MNNMILCYRESRDPGPQSAPATLDPRFRAFTGVTDGQILSMRIRQATR